MTNNEREYFLSTLMSLNKMAKKIYAKDEECPAWYDTNAKIRELQDIYRRDYGDAPVNVKAKQW